MQHLLEALLYGWKNPLPSWPSIPRNRHLESDRVYAAIDRAVDIFRYLRRKRNGGISAPRDDL
jgi:hypothetical protein